MNVEILAKVIANLFSEHKGLGAIHIDTLVDPSGNLALSTVSELLAAHYGNHSKPNLDSEPFSVIVTSEPTQLNGVLEANQVIVSCSPHEALKYRFGDRLVVCTGSADLSSFFKSFPAVFPSDFPLVASRHQFLGFAQSALVTVAHEALKIEYEPITEVVDSLSLIFEIVRDAYLHFPIIKDGGADVAAHILWFRHVGVGLTNLVKALELTESDRDLNQTLRDFVWAAFSLPTPDNGSHYKKSRDGKALAKRCLSHWSSEQLIENSLSNLESQYQDHHELRRLHWGNFDRISEVGESFQRVGPIMAWALVDSQNPHRTFILQLLSERDYFELSNEDDSPDIISLRPQFQSDGLQLNEGLPNKAVGLIDRTQIINRAVGPIIISDTIEIFIDGVELDELDIENLGIHLAVKTSGFTPVLSAAELRDGVVVLTCTVEYQGRTKSGVLKYVPSIIDLTVLVDADSPLSPYLKKPISTSLVLLSPSGSRAFFFGGAGSPQRNIKSAGSDEFSVEPWEALESVSRLKLEAGVENAVIMYVNDLSDSPTGPSIQLRAINDRPTIWLADNYFPEDGDVFESGNTRIEVEVADNAVGRPESPIIAAITKARPAGGLPKDVHRFSMRGQIEEYLGSMIRNEEFISSLGHIALPADVSDSIDGLALVDSGVLSATKNLAFRTALGDVEKIPSVLRNSDELAAFVEAFHALDLSSCLTVLGDDQSEFTQLISRISVRHLANSDLLNDYLDAYVKLLDLTTSMDNEIARFWTAYPFSVSIWRTNGGLQCRSVMLSPFHPVRLAWLANIEETLWKSPRAKELSGIVEGWNFPRIGPTNTRQGRLVAVPSDAGEDQLFMGWTLLARASVDGPQPLDPPDHAASLALPGTSSSGLNGEAVAGAIRDFRRVHTFMRTVTIDLAATKYAPKLEEIDRAVIAGFLGSNEKPEVCGLRVFDSLRREGDIPRIESSSESPEIPVTWKRYKPENAGQQPTKVNIRVLQDSGIAVEVQPRIDSRSGLMGPLPLRRFEISHSGNQRGNGLSVSQPALSGFTSQSHFATIINHIESCGESKRSPELHARIPQESPLGLPADWAVSGESLLSPSSLSQILSEAHGASRMLWEWNPPFLATNKRQSSGFSIDKRAYFSIASVPTVFSLRLREKLGWLLDREATEEEANQLLGYLGSRGIGLSRLLAIGGSQLHGAFGFFQVYRLFQEIKNTDQVRLVLPMDACQRFLEVIATDDVFDDSQKRADLLIIDLDKNGVGLTPVEIKFYGLENPVEVLPEPGSNTLGEARQQAIRSLRVLESVKDCWDGARAVGSPDLPLISNALSALVEVAVRLDPISEVLRGDVLVCMKNILESTAEITLGRPVVAYLVRAETGPRVKYNSTTSSGFDQTGCAEFIADPAFVFKDLIEGQGNSINAWKDVITWAATTIGSEKPTFASQDDAEIEDSDNEIDLVLDENFDPATLAGSVTSLPEDGGETAVATEPMAIAQEPVQQARSNDGTGEIIFDEGVRFPVGVLEGSIRSADADYWPANTNLNQLNIGVVGDLGTGKTQLLQSLVYQLRSVSEQKQAPSVSVLILDYKRDYQNEVFLRAVGGISFDPVHIPLDIFGIKGEKTPRAIQEKARSFADVIAKIFPGVGPRQISALTRSIRKLLAELDRSPTLNDVLDTYLEDVGDHDSVVAILENFVHGEIFSSDSTELKPLRELLEDRVLVINLAGLGADQMMKNAVVALFLNQYYEYMLTLNKWPYKSAIDMQLRALNGYLLVDEATNIMQYKFPVLSSILLQGREFGVGVMLSSQYLSHFDVPGVDYAEPLRSWFIHKVPNINQRQLARIGLAGANAADADRISGLPIHHAYFVSDRFHGRFIRTHPFYEIVSREDV